jgi:hypothetical protein
MVFQTVPLHISVEMSDYRDEGGTFREPRFWPTFRMAAPLG